MSSLASAFRFSPLRVFVLTSGQLRVFHWRSGNVDLPGASFAADEDGLRGFAHYLAQTPSMVSFMLVDMVEEEFRADTVPHVFGPDHSALLKTRLNRLFRDARYASYVMQGREPSGRRDDIVLFTALIRPELMAPWLGQLSKARVPLVGIYSVPVVSQDLLPKLPGEGRDVLLVTLQGAGGIRQTFFSNGKLKISRLAVAPPMDATRQAPYVLGEVENVRRYLNSLRLLQPGAPLDVVLLTGRRLLNDLKRQVSDTLAVRFHLLDLQDVGRSVGCKTPLNTPYADALFAHMLARTSPSNYYANSEDTHFMRLYRARGALSAGAILLLLTTMGYSGFQFVQSLLTEREASSFAGQAMFYEDRYRVGKARLPEVPADASEIKQAVELVDALRKYKSDPLQAMVLLSEVLSDFDTIAIDRLSWAASVDPDAVVSGSSGVTPKAVDFRTSRGVVKPLEKNVNYHLARVAGHIAPFTGDYRVALDTVNRFARALDRLQQVTSVKLTRLPFDASSRRRLRGTASRSKQREEARFELRIAVRVPLTEEAAKASATEVADGTR
jgi:hypothetical protein